MSKRYDNCCTNPPVVFSQEAINILYSWFPDSNGNLEADEVMDAIEGHHWGDNYPSKGAKELVDKVQALLDNGTIPFSPVLPD